MVCPKCGSTISEKDSVCANCGAKLGGVKTAAAEVGGSKRKLAIGIGCAVFLIFMICFAVLFGGKNKTALPLGAAWGDSYDAIAQKDAIVSDAALNESGDAYVCVSDHDGSFLNFSKDDLAVAVSYDLGQDDSLRAVTETVTVADGASISGEKFAKVLTDRYNNLYGTPASSDSSSTVWTADDCTVAFLTLSDGNYAIQLDPIA